MPAAIIIGAGISAAAGLYGAHKAASASKDAARTQSQSADRAMDVQRDIYRQQRQLVDPYAHAGVQALNSMMQQYGNAGRPMSGYQGLPSPALGWGSGSMGNPAEPQPQPRPVGSGMSLGAMQAQPHGGGMVMLQAPDGEVRPVPSHLAERMIQAGARRLN